MNIIHYFSTHVVQKYRAEWCGSSPGGWGVGVGGWEVGVRGRCGGRHSNIPMMIKWSNIPTVEWRAGFSSERWLANVLSTMYCESSVFDRNDKPKLKRGRTLNGNNLSPPLNIIQLFPIPLHRFHQDTQSVAFVQTTCISLGPSSS